MREWMCLGGPLDGTWRAAARGGTLRVGVLPDSPVSRLRDQDGPPPEVDVFVYRPLDIAASGEMVTVWAPEGWSREDALRLLVRYTTADALRLLLMRYRPPAVPAERG